MKIIESIQSKRHEIFMGVIISSFTSVGIANLFECIIDYNKVTLTVGLACVLVAVLCCVLSFLIFRKLSIEVDSALVLTKDGVLPWVYGNEYLNSLRHVLKSCFQENKAYLNSWNKSFSKSNTFLGDNSKEIVERINNSIPDKYTFLLKMDVQPLHTECSSILRDAIECQFLEWLSQLTTDYYNKHEEIKVNVLDRKSIYGYLQQNKLLELLSRDFCDRERFCDINVDKDDLQYVYSIVEKQTGISYERFELNFPKKTKLYRDKDGSLVIKSSLFQLKFSCRCDMTNYHIPEDFPELILKVPSKNCVMYHVPMSLTIRFNLWQVIGYNYRSEYQWLNQLPQQFNDYFSFSSYLEKIGFNVVRTNAYVRQRMSNPTQSLQK